MQAYSGRPVQTTGCSPSPQHPQHNSMLAPTLKRGHNLKGQRQTMHSTHCREDEARSSCWELQRNALCGSDDRHSSCCRGSNSSSSSSSRDLASMAALPGALLHSRCSAADMAKAARGCTCSSSCCCCGACSAAQCGWCRGDWLWGVPAAKECLALGGACTGSCCLLLLPFLRRKAGAAKLLLLLLLGLLVL